MATALVGERRRADASAFRRRRQRLRSARWREEFLIGAKLRGCPRAAPGCAPSSTQVAARRRAPRDGVVATVLRVRLGPGEARPPAFGSTTSSATRRASRSTCSARARPSSPRRRSRAALSSTQLALDVRRGGLAALLDHLDARLTDGGALQGACGSCGTRYAPLLASAAAADVAHLQQSGADARAGPPPPAGGRLRPSCSRRRGGRSVERPHEAARRAAADGRWHGDASHCYRRTRAPTYRT